MFTGIIEATGIVIEVNITGTNRSFWIQSPLSSEFKIDQSVSHNGVCLTVEEIQGQTHKVTAIYETLQKTNLTDWNAETIVNIERCLPVNGRLEGHFVQGHVDVTGTCVKRTEKNGSFEFVIGFPEKFAQLIVEKGSICLNGISLTAYDVDTRLFTVAVIPYTLEHTNVKNMKPGESVNLEFDLLGKYINRKITLSAV